MIKVQTYNFRNGGWSDQTRRHRFDLLLGELEATGRPADILFLSECAMINAFHQAPLWELTALLSRRLPGNAVYYPFINHRHGSRNHPGLFVNSAVVTPGPWFHSPTEACSEALDNTLRATVAGHTMHLGSVHWEGGRGPRGFDIQSAQLGELAKLPAICGGDFNATSSAPGEVIHEDWHERMAPWPQKRRQKGHEVNGRWEIYTKPMDDLLEAGWWDTGEAAKDFTVTINDHADGGSGLRIDRILVTNKTPMRLVEDTYRVYPTEHSDHRIVECEVEPTA